MGSELKWQCDKCARIFSQANRPTSCVNWKCDGEVFKQVPNSQPSIATASNSVVTEAMIEAGLAELLGPHWCAGATNGRKAVQRILEAAMQSANTIGSDELVALLRREGAHSGIWFADKLIEAADEIERLHAIATPDSERVAVLEDHIREQITHAETRIADGKELGASVWRIALEDIVRENRAALSQPIGSENGHG